MAMNRQIFDAQFRNVGRPNRLFIVLRFGTLEFGF